MPNRRACTFINFEKKKSPLHGLVWVCTFFDFEKKFPPARLFHPAHLLVLVKLKCSSRAYRTTWIFILVVVVEFRARNAWDYWGHDQVLDLLVLHIVKASRNAFNRRIHIFLEMKNNICKSNFPECL